MSNLPRWIKSDAVYAEVQRTVDRSLLFKPGPAVRQIIGTSAGRALAKFLDQYWQASALWLRGNRKVEFPRGSYKPPDIRAVA